MDDLKLYPLAHALRLRSIRQPDHQGLPPPLREARAFADLLEHLPIGITPDEPLAGQVGAPWAEPSWVAALLQEKDPSAVPPMRPDVAAEMHERFHCFGGYAKAHTMADYDRVLRLGVDGLLDEIHRQKSDLSAEKCQYLDAMEIALGALCRLAERYATLAASMAKAERDPARRERLLGMAKTCQTVPLHPARTFLEAVQCVSLVTLVVGLSEYSAASLSLGRADQYLEPFFARELDGGIGETGCREILADLVRKIHLYSDAACCVNLGGADAHGRDQFNAFSRLWIDVVREQGLPGPLLTVRLHPGMSAADFDRVADPTLFRRGQPTFYGETACRQALIQRGVPSEQVHRWAANSCMGLIMPGEEISNMWGGVANLLLPLELAVNGGKPFRGEFPLPWPTPAATAHRDFDALFSQVQLYIEELVDWVVAQSHRATETEATERPNPFFSSLIRDCIARGQDRAGGGAIYHTVVIEGFGLVNAADALVAIRRLVYEKESHSLADLVAAARTNFEGQDRLRRQLLQMPKYGNGLAEADAMAVKVAQVFARRVAHHNGGTCHYMPSLHTLNVHVPAGKKTAASLDGRRDGEALAKNAGTSPGRVAHGHTALLRSAAAIPQAVFCGGQAVDLSVDPAMLQTSEGRGQFRALLQSYFDLGGLEVQVNGLNARQLREAMAAPEQHQDLIVRIGGFSVRYVTLPMEVQAEMASRFEEGL